MCWGLKAEICTGASLWRMAYELWQNGAMGEAEQGRGIASPSQCPTLCLHPILLKDSLKHPGVSLCPKSLLFQWSLGQGWVEGWLCSPSSPSRPQLLLPSAGWRPVSLQRGPLRGITLLMDVACLRESSASRSRITQMCLLFQIIH